MNRSLDLSIPLLLFLFLTAMFPYLPGMGYDMHNCFEPWAVHIKRQGLINAYASDTDYMPIFQYMLWVYEKLAGTEKAVIDNLRYISCFVLLGDYIGVWYVYKWTDKKTAYFVMLLLCILNLGYSYNTILWGQIDGILCALIFMSVYYAYKGNNLLGAVCMVLAFNFKIQCIVIVPVWGLLMLNNVLSAKGSANVWWKQVVLPILAAAAAQFILLVPFMMGDYGPRRIIYIIGHSFSKYQSISIKAANIWHWLVRDKGDLLYASDTMMWIGGLTYKQAGLIMFFTAAFFAMWPLLKVIISKLRGNTSAMPSREMVWITGALVYLLFYFLNTEMHERYCQPAFIFITAYAFFTRDFFPWIVFSIMYFLTLEFSAVHFRLANYDTFIFDLRFLAGLTAVTIGYLYYRLYRHYNIRVAKEAHMHAGNS
jgi:Gpi18-like mannosyltransferase